MKSMTNNLLLLPVMVWILASSFAIAQDDTSWASTERTDFKPDIHNSNIRSVQLFAQNPEIVTPVGIAVAPDGRVFVQENHTHKRTSSYGGPKTDRILVFEDTNGDGIADKRSIFYEGHTFSTDLLFGPDGHLYVSTRWFIGRFQDAANKQTAGGEPEILVRCETDGNYPHNGVGGLAIDPANPNWLAFGFGENLGADYAFIGSDGKQLSGGAEGGSTYLCRTDGSGLVRQSTGHWNAFGMAYDLAGNLFSTDNDPNATPPNRLLHVIPGADFGYEYRYGRSGRHPLVCWYGEKPGTLGMIGALGEAACGLVPHGPKQLLSASWTDNRIDLHSLEPKGVSFAATREPFLSGPDDFRPVHFAYSADGRYLYFTDWVKLSYPVHGHGRIWRVEFKEPIELVPTTRETAKAELTTKLAFDSLGSDDPYLRTQAIHRLASSPNELASFGWPENSNAIVRAHFAVALKRSQLEDAEKIIPELLGDSDPDVRYVGIKWIADEKIQTYESELKELLSRADLNRSDLRATMAALERLASGSNKEFSPNDTLLELALDKSRPASLRALALQSVQVKHKPLTVELLAELTQSTATAIKREAVRSLVLHPDSNRVAALARIAANESLDENLRADAIAGLLPLDEQQADMLQSLFQSSRKSIYKE
ncbi:MAG: PVC-type heme-binding CxxCH protein [Planctomycetota bacterium]